MYERGKFEEDAEAPVVRPQPTLEGLEAWLKARPRETRYDKFSITDCLLCRFFSDVKGRPVGFGEIYQESQIRFPCGSREVRLSLIAHNANTYGEALDQIEWWRER